ncbi:hypothetical protein ACFZB9_27565 [Kitasatospora sp. NPDC008050]|uniref:hypothetical protein n=1 Tax=Kitasatospora sp. NPDC008050 TaxID=3364021 RepID=UPI0036F0AAF7
MGDLIRLPTRPPRVERAIVTHLDVAPTPDAAVGLDLHLGPGEHLAFALTRHQAEDLLHALAAHLGHRVLGVRR